MPNVNSSAHARPTTRGIPVSYHQNRKYIVRRVRNMCVKSLATDTEITHENVFLVEK